MHRLAAPVGFWYFSPRRKVHVGVAFTLQKHLQVDTISYCSVLTIFPLYVAEGFASAEATKGLCGRPLETFALHSHVSWFLSLQGEIASAEAKRGLSDRPLDPFGADTPMLLGLLRKFFRVTPHK